MKRLSSKTDLGMGKGGVFLLVILVVFLAVLGMKVTSKSAPAIDLHGQLKGLGQSTPVEFEVRDPQHRVKSVQLEVRQSGRVFVLPVAGVTAEAPTSWWKFWAKRPESKTSVQTRVGRKEIPDLQEGRATLVITATNDSRGRLFRGGRRGVTPGLAAGLMPPPVHALGFCAL